MKLRILLVLLALALLGQGCSLVGSGSDVHPSSSGSEDNGRVVLVTHDSFALPKQLIRQFEQQSGDDLVVRSSGDAGTLTSKLSLTAGDPTGDVAFGVDNTFASRALDAGVFADSGVTLPPGADRYALPGDGGDKLAPIDNGNVCINTDTTWFRAHHLPEPQSLDDLTDPRYRGLLAVPSAASSSPGMAFLLTTIAAKGDGWQAYWKRLLANDVKLVDGWTEAYYGEFTQGGEGGKLPIVLSYDSSPAFTVDKATKQTTTRALLDTCFQQVEYAGVLAGADNPTGARKFVQWLLSADVQAALPDSMYVYPVRDGVSLPDDWSRYTKQPSDPWSLDPADIAEHRDQWLQEWRDLVAE